MLWLIKRSPKGYEEADLEQFKVILKGLWVGSTMTVPGVSGGTMAVIIGIYEDLIHALNGMRKCPKEYITFLFQFICGAGAGFLVFAGGITCLLANPVTGVPTRFFFCGIVVGGIPLLVEKTGIKKLRLRHIIFLFCGAAVVLMLMRLPSRLFSEHDGFSFILMQLGGGVIIAAALVLPGISVTHMLYIMGLYEIVLAKVYALHFLELLPLAVGVFLGTFLTAGILEQLIKQYPAEIYMGIIGFVAGSMSGLIPEKAFEYPLSGMGMMGIGFLCMYLLSKRADGDKTLSEAGNKEAAK